MTVSGLVSGRTYYFAMKVQDDTGTPSALSNVVSATTDAPDSTAPAAVTDLRGSPPFTSDRLEAVAIAASSVESVLAGFAKATDGISTSYWGSVGRKTAAPEWITIDMGSVRNVGEVRIASRPAGAMFPEDLEIHISNNNTSFTRVMTATGLPSTRGIVHSLRFPIASGRYLRVVATKTRQSAGGLYAAQIAEIQVFDASAVNGPVTLTWTATGDDGKIGTATRYDLRYSTAPIINLSTFIAATQVSGEPTPGPAGTLQSMDVNLPRGTFYFAIRATDEAGNDSGVSNVPVIVVP
jgi:hypothetical protein